MYLGKSALVFCVVYLLCPALSIAQYSSTFTQFNWGDSKVGQNRVDDTIYFNGVGWFVKDIDSMNSEALKDTSRPLIQAVTEPRHICTNQAFNLKLYLTLEGDWTGKTIGGLRTKDFISTGDEGLGTNQFDNKRVKVIQHVFVYTLIPKHAGALTIEPFLVEVAGKVYSSDVLRIYVNNDRLSPQDSATKLKEALALASAQGKNERIIEIDGTSRKSIRSLRDSVFKVETGKPFKVRYILLRTKETKTDTLKGEMNSNFNFQKETNLKGNYLPYNIEQVGASSSLDLENAHSNSGKLKTSTVYSLCVEYKALKSKNYRIPDFKVSSIFGIFYPPAVKIKAE